jgi:TetR/AcrR family transcriptional regulator, acrAB operon repressor
MVKKTKADAELTRQHLLDAAELLFLERGVSRTSLQDIASAAGATRGAIYWHFKDKADLFNAMMARVVLPLEQALQSAANTTAEHGCTPLQRLVKALLCALHATAHDPQTRRVFTIATHKVEYVDELRAVAERHLEVMRGVLAATAQALQSEVDRTGQALPLPVATAARGLHALADGLINNWLLEPEVFDLEAVGRDALHTYLRGLGFNVS